MAVMAIFSPDIHRSWDGNGNSWATENRKSQFVCVHNFKRVYSVDFVRRRIFRMTSTSTRLAIIQARCHKLRLALNDIEHEVSELVKDFQPPPEPTPLEIAIANDGKCWDE